MKAKFAIRALSSALVMLTATFVQAQINVLNLPPRPLAAKTGSQFKDEILNLPRDARELAIYREITSGNVPDFIRNLKPVTISTTISGQSHTATLYVTPEYMSVGTNADYFRMPMTPLLAQWIADATSTSLPTRKIVNSVWSAAPCKLTPTPISPSPAMITVPVFWDHQQTVQSQRNAMPNPPGDIVGGHKKDVIITPRLYDSATPDRVAIYGWHYTNGTFIQNIYVGHEETYADYSHGLRLINSQMLLDGTTVTIQDVLISSAVSSLLNDETAAFTNAAPPRYQAGSPPAGFPYIDSFPSTGRQLTNWVNRFTAPTTLNFSPPSPGGDGYIIVIKDPSGGIDTQRIGSTSDTDYAVQADIFCDYRPALSADGFERLGIFARDDGNGMFCGQNGAGTIKGNNYALTWDSNNGRLQCLRTINAVPVDLLSAPIYLPASQWRQMRIEAVGSQITFKIDGNSVLSITDATHPDGQFGIGYQEVFTTNTNIRGTYADNFKAERLALAKVNDWQTY